MELVVITLEQDIPYEVETIKELVGEGIIVHIRKKSKPVEEMREYLLRFSIEERKGLTLHAFHQLAIEFDLGGIHLGSEENLNTIKEWSGRLSRSCHSFEQLDNIEENYSYVFLSPVYDSISKKKYRSAFDPDYLKEKLAFFRTVPVYALGGVAAERLEELKAIGFAGAALSGDFWFSGARNLTQYLEKQQAHA